MTSTGRLRIALVAPPMLPVPPPTYAGTERVVAALGDELLRLGHDVTLFAPGDSEFGGRVEPTIEQSLWRSGYKGDVSAYMQVSVAKAWEQHERFDIIHSHAEMHGFLLSRYCPTPVVSTLHGRLDAWGVPELLGEFREIPLVAISDSQRRWHPDANWVATIHHGLPLAAMPFSNTPGEYLAFVGRITPEKGVEDAIELARLTGRRLKMAAKVYDAHEREHFKDVVQPAIDAGVVDFLGEVGPAQRDPLYAGAFATIMLGAWPEPFGLVAIESLGTGTPVVARRAGALTETIEHGVDGFLVDDLTEANLAIGRVGQLDRAEIRRRALDRFSPNRMADEYLGVYRRLIADRRNGSGSPPQRELVRAARG
jgi:glycosyltransferase involved in cell wall biosynthesis